MRNTRKKSPNMSYATDFLSQGFTELAAFLGDSTGPQTITIEGADIPCIPNALQRGTVLEIGGKLVEVEFKIFIQRGEFLTADTTLETVDTAVLTSDLSLPSLRSGMKPTYKGKTYRVASVKEVDSHFEIFLADPNSGR